MSNTPSLEQVHAAVACLGRLAEVFRQRRQQLASSVGLTEQQWSVLDEIENADFMPSMFARRRESSAAAVSKILRQLQDKELVVVSLNASDGRQRHYELSDQGKRALGRLREQRQAALAEVWQQFDATTLLDFTRFGNELIERLERYSSDNEHTSTAARRGSGNGKDTVRQGV
jgi:DNA-binding MarR family transcriptional regulator